MLKLIFELFPEDERVKPYDHPFGYIFRGVIMKWLQEKKPELIHYLHEYDQIRPYSINCYIHKDVPKIDFTLVSYFDELSDFLIQDLLKSENIKLKIGQKDYYISKINFERINLKTFIDQSKAVKGFNINFATPVYFNTILGNYPVRFPLPELFFGNLINIWNDINDLEFEIERKVLLNWINAHVYISGYKMRSVRREIGKRKPVVGGLGNATYRVTKINKNYYKHFLEELDRKFDYHFVNENYEMNCKWLEVLCKMGEYTNVGGNRTAGMGVIRYYSKYYISEKDYISSKQ
jgi:CRISPR/Cas system endoribonuclease Cas6 (RAMP superfamily)